MKESIRPIPFLILFLTVRAKIMTLVKPVTLVDPSSAFFNTYHGDTTILVVRFGGLERMKEHIIFHSDCDSHHEVD